MSVVHQMRNGASQALDVDEDACLLLDELLPMGGATERLRLHIAVKTEVWQSCYLAMARLSCFHAPTLTAGHWFRLAKLTSCRCLS